MKIYTMTLGFCPARVLAAGMKSYYETALVKPDAHYFLDQHYPLHRKQNLEDLQKVCAAYGLTYVDSGEDRGLCGGFNFLIPQIPFEPGDLLIGCDPDAKPERAGWDKAMVEVLAEAPELDFVTCSQSFTNDHIYPQGIIRGVFRTVAGHHVFQVEMPTLDMFTLSAVRYELIKGRKLESRMSYWGGTEDCFRNWLIERGKTYGYMLEYQENNGHAHLGDPEYREYKNALINGYVHSFAEFLKK